MNQVLSESNPSTNEKQFLENETKKLFNWLIEIPNPIKCIKNDIVNDIY